MKKLTFLLTVLFLTVAVNSQTLEEIVKNYSIANKMDKVAATSTIKISGKMSMMGMEMPMTFWMKNPNKIKSITSVNGQDIISVFDGVKGYSINPMTDGSTTPKEMDQEQIMQTQNSNIFQNPLLNFFKKGQLSLEGQENVNDKPAFKIKANLEGGNFVYMFIDKDSYLVSKTTATVNQGGTTITVDSYPTEYTDYSGILIPAKTTTSASGMEFVMIFDKVEVNLPMEDSLFSVK
jgi:hypothetical protein